MALVGFESRLLWNVADDALGNDDVWIDKIDFLNMRMSLQL